MRLNSQAVLERLVDLLYDNLDRPAVEVLGMLQAELRIRESEEANRVRQMALDSLYQVARVDTVEVWDDLRDEVRRVVKPIERVAVRYSDLPEFAKVHGLNVDELMQVLRFERLEVTGRGGKVWRSGDRNRKYEETTPEQVESQEMQREFTEDSKEHASAVAKRNSLKLNIGKYVEPVLHEWRPK